MTEELEEQLTTIEAHSLCQLARCSSTEELEQWRVAVMGRRGKLSVILRSLPNLDPSTRPVIGALANQTKVRLEAALDKRKYFLLNQPSDVELADKDRIDVTLPSRSIKSGSHHPTTQIVKEISEAFATMGFQTIEGPEVELDSYNFQKLNIPLDHPARDMWNSLWIKQETSDQNSSLLLRTHTSPMQVRVMENNAPPIRVLVPGKAYRYEATDATHEWQFTQIEGLAVDKNITFANLKATLEEFAQRIFGDQRRTRFRCDFFPFVEPGAEMSIDCFRCDGEGCRVCGNSGWIEILGAGMVHPEVLKGVGYDPGVYTGFAFGMGAERISMLRHGIDDIRHFHLNDLRFLRQFA